MSAEVVDLSKARRDARLIWVCSCGCTTFRLFADGYAECAGCEERARGEPEGWRERLPPEPAEPIQVEPDAFAVKSIDDADVFLKRTANNAADIATVIILRADGTIATWQRGDAVRGWIVEQLDHAKTRLVRI